MASSQVELRDRHSVLQVEIALQKIQEYSKAWKWWCGYLKPPRIHQIKFLILSQIQKHLQCLELQICTLQGTRRASENQCHRVDWDLSGLMLMKTCQLWALYISLIHNRLRYLLQKNSKKQSHFLRKMKLPKRRLRQISKLWAYSVWMFLLITDLMIYQRLWHTNSQHAPVMDIPVALQAQQT